MDDERLKRYFHFDDRDLLANRTGRLSENQAKRREVEARAERKSARESMGILLVVAAMGFGFGLLIVVNAPILSAKILIGLALCVMWPLGWGWRAWQAGRSRGPERESPVRAARGRVSVIRHEDDFVLELEGFKFDLEKDPSGVIADGDELVVFYLEETEDILSAQAL